MIKNKKDAWVLLCGVRKSDNSVKLKYHHLCKLIKAAAEKAQNAWWSACAAEVEKRAWAAEQCGHGGSLIRELHLLRKSASKPSTSILLMRNGNNLTGDDDKPQSWVKHFSDVINCESEVSVVTLDVLPVLEPPAALSDDVCVNELSDNLTEEEIAAAISQMRK